MLNGVNPKLANSGKSDKTSDFYNNLFSANGKVEKDI